MARSAIDKVEFFSHDSHSSDGKTLTIIEGEWGNDGYAFWFKLLERLADSDGHYYDARSDDDLEFLARKCGVDGITATGILNKLAKLGAIDAEMWASRVIWSENFVKRLAEVYRKRGRELPQKPDFCDGNNGHYDESITIPATRTPIPAPEIPQRKKESRESRVEKDKGIPATGIPEWIDKATWDDFLKMRKKLKAPPTDKAIQLLIRDLENLRAGGDDPNEVLNQSIKNGWKGLFELKKGGGNSNGQREYHGNPSQRPSGAFADLE